MKTLEQYRKDVAALLEQIGKIRAKAENQNRDLTDDEVGHIGDLNEEIKRVSAMIEVLVEADRLTDTLKEPVAPQTVPKDQTPIVQQSASDKRHRFASLGEQLMATIRAGQPGGRVDPRLFTAAASGLNETVPAEGGFLVQTDFAAELLQQVYETGILAPRCRRYTISSGANAMTINGVDETSRASTRSGGVKGYWIGEADDKTGSKPKFRQIELKLKKLIGLCYVTDEMLADAAILDGFVRNAFAAEFGFLLDDAIIRGAGGAQPLGILNSGSLVTVSKEAGQKAKTILYQNVINMYSRMFARSRTNAVWLINQEIEPQLFTMSLAVGTGGIPVYVPPGGASGSPYAMLMGRPVMAIEQCSALGDVGDIIFADLGGYILAEKGGIESAMSIHVRFTNDETAFRFVMRVDGQPERATALTPYKGGSDLSHFVALEKR